MKKVLLSLSLIATLFGADKLLAENKALKIIKNTPIYSKLKSKIEKKEIKVKGTEKGNFYIITLYNNKGEQSLFVTKDLKYTILGVILNNKTGKVLEPNYPVEPFKGDKNIVKNGVVFSFGTGKKELYVVTDPECPFCQRFEKLAKEAKLSEKYRIHIIFLPLSFHKHSKAMIYYILSADSEQEKVKRFHKTLMGDTSWKSFKPTADEKAKIDKEIEKSKKAATELGVRGTPSFFDKDMKEIKNKRSLFQ